MAWFNFGASFFLKCSQTAALLPEGLGDYVFKRKQRSKSPRTTMDAWQPSVLEMICLLRNSQACLKWVEGSLTSRFSFPLVFVRGESQRNCFQGLRSFSK